MTESDQDKNPIIKKSLPKTQKAFYGIGHILNDLCANCWFSYALIFWTKIVGLTETDAGLLLLIGQLADAISTVFVGQACDRTKFRWYGKRKLWHIIGTLCVMMTFPFIFNLCLTCEDSSDMSKLFYYAAFVIVFQFGWAATQISHLSLIPEIARRASDIVHLNSIRSGLLFVCGIFVYGMTWFLLGRADGEEVDSSLAPQFKYLSIIVICVGLVFVIIFHFGTIEKRTVKEKKINDIESPSSTQEKRKTWKQWLKDSRFYKTGLLYMCTRLAINVYQSFFVLYLTDALHFNKEAIAYFPLILLISGALTSSIMQKLTKKIGSQLTYIFGASFIIGSSVWLFSTDRSGRNSVYGATVLAGCGISIILVTSLAKTADMIGKDKESGAFVYSCMSFLDKLSTGIVIFIIQALKPIPGKNEPCIECEWFSKIVQTVVPGACVSIGLLCMVFLFPSEFMCIRKSEFHTKQSSLSKSHLMDPDVEIISNNDNKQNKENDFNPEQMLELYYEKSATVSSSSHKNKSFKEISNIETTSSHSIVDLQETVAVEISEESKPKKSCNKQVNAVFVENKEESDKMVQKNLN